MCIAIYQDAGQNLGDDLLFNAWTNNPDGGGFAYFRDGQPHVEKYMTWTSYIKNLRKAKREHPDSPFVLHMRIKTHGTVCIENTHPFYVDENTVMAHNGIISGVTYDETNKNDTRHFIEQYIRELPDDWLDNLALSRLVEDFIGNSKLVFLTSNPDLEYGAYILNSHKGHWDHDRDGSPNMWFSNSSYKRKKKYKTGRSKYGGRTIGTKKGSRSDAGKESSQGGDSGDMSGKEIEESNPNVTYADTEIIIMNDGRVIERGGGKTGPSMHSSYEEYHQERYGEAWEEEEEEEEEVEKAAIISPGEDFWTQEEEQQFSSLLAVNKILDEPCPEEGCDDTLWQCECGHFDAFYSHVLINNDVTNMDEAEVDELCELARKPVHELTTGEWNKLNGHEEYAL